MDLITNIDTMHTLEYLCTLPTIFSLLFVALLIYFHLIIIESKNLSWNSVNALIASSE